MSKNFLDILKEKIVVFDGAMGSNLQSQNLTIEDWGGANFENCSENLLYTKPEAIETGSRRIFGGWVLMSLKPTVSAAAKSCFRNSGLPIKPTTSISKRRSWREGWRTIIRLQIIRVLSPVRSDRERNCRRSDIFLMKI